jgi:cyanophycinase-like exopeptidase
MSRILFLVLALLLCLENTAVCAAPTRRMMTGDGDFTVIDGRKVDTREGLCLLPGTIVDQHFLKRQWENRLFGLILDAWPRHRRRDCAAHHR